MGVLVSNTDDIVRQFATINLNFRWPNLFPSFCFSTFMLLNTLFSRSSYSKVYLLSTIVPDLL